VAPTPPAGPAATEARGRARTSLLDLDADFGTRVPAHEHNLASRATGAETMVLHEGGWNAVDWAHERPDLFAVVVVDGLVMRRLAVNGYGLPELFGPGDVLERPCESVATVHTTVRFEVLRPTRLALLGTGFVRAAARWPCMLAELQRRQSLQQHRLAAHGAICQMPRVECRLVALLMLLAEDWARVSPRGMILDLRLTHEALGTFVGARRPTVTLALKTLDRDGVVQREDDGSWLLAADAAQWLAAAHQRHDSLKPLLLKRSAGARAVSTRARRPRVPARRPGRVVQSAPPPARAA
jgi:hypothetical protein